MLMRVVDVDEGVLSVEEWGDILALLLVYDGGAYVPASLVLVLSRRVVPGGSLEESRELLELVGSLVPDEKESCW